MSTGALAVLVAQPTEVVKVRFQAAARSGGAKYSSTLGAYKCIAKNEGFQGLWRGRLPLLLYLFDTKELTKLGSPTPKARNGNV